MRSPRTHPDLHQVARDAYTTSTARLDGLCSRSAEWIARAVVETQASSRDARYYEPLVSGRDEDPSIRRPTLPRDLRRRR